MASLLIEIARCVNVPVARASSNHPCHQVVAAQAVAPHDFHVPEPWSGDLASAPILFISSNPALAQASRVGEPDAEYPTADWDAAVVSDFFTHRFGDGQRGWVVGGNRALLTDGSHGKANAFWSAVKKRAEELLEREAVPGVDYALTELVHCKSRGEHGVREAVSECARLYLTRVLESSGAAVIVALGSIAADALRTIVNVSAGRVSEPFVLAQCERIVVLLPHPNARTVRSLTGCLAPEELDRLVSHLRGRAGRRSRSAGPLLFSIRDTNGN
ncbi:MAG: uracil-DNA glycosylase family protein [Thermoanaerobaculia bacterium]